MLRQRRRCRKTDVERKKEPLMWVPSDRNSEMKIPYHHIDAFTERPFTGNPAGNYPFADVPGRSAMQGPGPIRCPGLVSRKKIPFNNPL
jgi:hypothetical protein